MFISEFPKLAYNIFFQNDTTEAAKELSQDVRRTLRATLRTVDSPPPAAFLEQTDSFLRGWDSVSVVCPPTFHYLSRRVLIALDRSRQSRSLHPLRKTIG